MSTQSCTKQLQDGACGTKQQAVQTLLGLPRPLQTPEILLDRLGVLTCCDTRMHVRLMCQFETIRALM